jgi:hypothetical protein
MPRLLYTALLVLATVAVPGCADSLFGGEGDEYTLPEPDRSLDPAKLSIGDYLAMPCGTNHELRSRSERVLVDIFFGRKSNRDPMDRAQAAHLQAVTSRGGAVLYRFNVPAVRARINRNQNPDLIATGHWITVREVPNPARYDLPVNVGYTRPLRDSDLGRFRELGGRITHRFDFINGISGELPDDSLPQLRSSSDVLYVEPNGIGCLAG